MKKKNLLKKMGMMAVFTLLGTSAMAEEYHYLTFETTDGAKASVEINSLSMTINGATLVAGNQTFPLSNLSKMYFSVSDETSSATGIRQLDNLNLQDILAVYDLQGHKIAKEQMKKGVYIVKTPNGTYKIASK